MTKTALLPPDDQLPQPVVAKERTSAPDPYAGVGGTYELNMVTGECKPTSKAEAT
jgi:hypothetical protein